MVKQETIVVRTSGRGSTEISSQIDAFVSSSGIAQGLCNVFIQHTSASVMLCENADASVRGDLETFMQKLVPDGDAMFRHVAEGPDDMSAHVRSILTDSSLTIPISGGRCMLGTWQGIYLWEHRTQSHTRQIILTVYGE
ncbi:MAG: secondary thiamine-phosphate synthase enzyme [Gammaproteobacteria bacterium]|jgi:secondary thiamine-phosphate synthase enzyme